MLLPDCKCCSGFFAVICLLPFFLLLLPPLFPSCPAAVSVVVLSAVSAGLALFPFCSHCCFCRCSFCCPGCSCAVPVALPAAFLSLPSPNFPCRPMRPVPPCPALSRPVLSCPVLSCPVPGSPRSGHATRIGSYTKGRCKIVLQRPRCRNVLVVPHPAGESCRDVDPGNPAGIVARKILRGCLSGVFCMGARDPCVVRLPGRAGLDVYRIRFRT